MNLQALADRTGASLAVKHEPNKGKIVISLYDYTGEAVKPWAERGYTCLCYDLQHEGYNRVDYPNGGSITYVHMDLYNPVSLRMLAEVFTRRNVVFAQAFPVCTDIAVSGARHYAKKALLNPDFQVQAADKAKAASQLFTQLGCPYYIENPVSVLSTLWRKPNHTFHPFEYGGYIPKSKAQHPLYPDYIAPRDAYSKKTCLWVGGGFKMPRKLPVECDNYGASQQFKKLGGKSMKTKNIRSATPRGFAEAVYQANKG